MSQSSFNPPWFVRKDLDGFFGLMIDNLIQLILIVSLCRELIHLPDSFIFGRILPGAAISILVGNFFYAWQAHRLARETGREDVTALPYGINTVSLFAFVFFIMLPIYQETKDPVWAWKVGLVACFLNGIIEIIGAFIAESVRRVTPRAALLSALAGIAITFISMDFTFKIFAQPLVAMVPMAIIFVAYFSHQKLPLGLPGGMVAIAIGTIMGWLLGTMSGKSLGVNFAVAMPTFAGGSLWEALTDPAFLNYFSVILPMGIFNVVGSLQNIESAEAAGDRFPTFSSLMVNGIGSVVAALFGSVFATTIYIGHPGWKRLGARSGYSALNGLFIAFLCLTGTIQGVLNLIPLEAGIGILLYIGIIIVAQSFQETPVRSWIGAVRSEPRDPRYDLVRAGFHFQFDDSRLDWCGFDREGVRQSECLVARRGVFLRRRHYSRLRSRARWSYQSIRSIRRAGVCYRLPFACRTLLGRLAYRKEWSSGVMECWSIGRDPSLQYSNTPVRY